MASTDLANSFIAEPFNHQVQEEETRSNRILSSGIAIMNPMLSAMLNTAGGTEGNLPHYKPLPLNEPNYSNDNPAVFSTPKNIDYANQRYKSYQVNESWGVMDLVPDLALEDPWSSIASSVGGFWGADSEERMLAQLRGIAQDSIDNHGGDLIHDITTGGAPAAANLVNAAAIIAAIQLMGDKKTKIRGMMMHSVPHAKLQELNLTSFIPNARGEIDWETYLNKYVVVDDSIVPDTTGPNPVYDIYMFGAAFFHGGDGRVRYPTAITRNEDAGNGGGEEILHSRRHKVWHPWGYNYNNAVISAQSPTYADLEDPTNYTRVLLRKNIPLTILRTNG